jgi:two-component system sensor histidine kinase ChvG
MLSSVLKNLSILKKFLFINSIVFIIIGCGTIFYLKTVQPNLIKKKTANHVQIIDNTIDHIQRLNIKFNEDDIRKFLFSTRFLFQNLDRVIFFDKKFNLIGDTDTLDLDPRAFPKKTDIVEQETLDDQIKVSKKIKKKTKKKRCNFFKRSSN